MLSNAHEGREPFIEALHAAYRHGLSGHDSAAERVVRRVLEIMPPEHRASAGNTIRSVVQSELARVKPELQAFEQTRRYF